jgi:hypothetical protein
MHENGLVRRWQTFDGPEFPHRIRTAIANHRNLQQTSNNPHPTPGRIQGRFGKQDPGMLCGIVPSKRKNRRNANPVIDIHPLFVLESAGIAKTRDYLRTQ